jgi:hypothetical protein
VVFSGATRLLRRGQSILSIFDAHRN